MSSPCFLLLEGIGFLLVVNELENCVGQLLVGFASFVAHLYTPHLVYVNTAISAPRSFPKSPPLAEVRPSLALIVFTWRDPRGKKIKKFEGRWKASP